MTGRHQRATDPLWRSLVLARLARMRSARAARHTEELRRRWPADNVIEGVLLRRRLQEGDQDDEGDRDGSGE